MDDDFDQTRVEPGARACEVEGCDECGSYRAPRAPDALSDYRWFCLEHVRAYNAAWDFFRGKSADQIEAFRRDQVTGARPTWRFAGKRKVPLDFADAYRLFAGAGAAGPLARGLDRRTRRCLATLSLDQTATLHQIKMRYKQLAKRHHPDANGGDKAAEERIKTINEAYHHLLNCRAF